MAQQFAALGVAPEQALRIVARAAAPDEMDTEAAIWPENWGAVRVFAAMSTQWRRAGMAGVPVGLDYAVLPVVAAAHGVACDGDLLARLAMIESAALRIMLDRAGRR